MNILKVILRGFNELLLYISIALKAIFIGFYTLLNNRLRKVLDYKTPKEALLEEVIYVKVHLLLEVTDLRPTSLNSCFVHL